MRHRDPFRRAVQRAIWVGLVPVLQERLLLDVPSVNRPRRWRRCGYCRKWRALRHQEFCAVCLEEARLRLITRAWGQDATTGPDDAPAVARPGAGSTPVLRQG